MTCLLPSCCFASVIILDRILGISEASFLCAEGETLTGGGSEMDLHSVAKLVLSGIQLGRLPPGCLKEPEW